MLKPAGEKNGQSFRYEELQGTRPQRAGEIME